MRAYFIFPCFIFFLTYAYLGYDMKFFKNMAKITKIVNLVIFFCEK